MQIFGAPGRDQFFRSRDTVTGKKGMGVEVDIERHCEKRNLTQLKWKAPVSKNGRLFVKRLAAARKALFRKGGLAEGRAGFSFKSSEFFLFPTWFHEQPEKVRNRDIAIPEPNADKINIKLFAKLELVRVINSWRIVEALEPLHILQRDVVRERFEYDEAPGVHVGFVKIFRLTPSWSFPDNKKYGGCRSWLKLPIPPTDLRFDPVLSEAEQARRRDQFLKIVGAAEASAASGA